MSSFLSSKTKSQPRNSTTRNEDFHKINQQRQSQLYLMESSKKWMVKEPQKQKIRQYRQQSINNNKDNISQTKMQTTSKYVHTPNASHNPNTQPTGTSTLGTGSTNYRKFQHRRIHTELEQPTQQPITTKYHPYLYQQGPSTIYKKDSSNNKLQNPNSYTHITATNHALGNNQSSQKMTASHLSTNPVAFQSKEGLSTLTKNYKYAVKPNTLGSKYLKTQPDADDNNTFRNKTGNTNNNRNMQIFNNKYEIEGVAGKGTFGVVYFGKNILNGKRVALKKVLQDKKYKNRQLQILKQVKHTNILEMRDFFLTTEGPEEYLNVVMDYFSDNLYQVIKKKQINPLLVKLYTYQVLRGLNYLNMLSIAHRDIKPQNILVDRNTHKVVICDFGSAKRLVKGQPNIAYICSRCYRAPELIFGATQYTSQIDMWSLGCVVVQMVNGQAPFLGDSQIDQLLEIIKILGTPQKADIQEMNPKYDLRQYKKFPNIKSVSWAKILKTDDALLVDLVTKILEYSPKRRVTAAQALNHPYFEELKQLSNSTESKDLEYLRKMKIKQMPQLYDFTPQQIICFGVKDKNKKKQKLSTQIITQSSESEQFNVKIQKPVIQSPLGELSAKQPQKIVNFRNVDYKASVIKQTKNDFNLREDEIKLQRSNNPTYRAITKKLPVPGLTNTSSLGTNAGNSGPQNTLFGNHSHALSYGRNQSNRFQYR